LAKHCGSIRTVGDQSSGCRLRPVDKSCECFRITAWVRSGKA
jgi:hypothetical protein